MEEKSRGRYRLLIFVAAFLFSTGGVAIKACSLNGWQVAGFRSGVAAAVLFGCIPGARRGWTWRTALIASAYALTLISFVIANKLTTSANAIFLQSTAPLYMLFLSPAILREKVVRADIAVFIAVGCGMALLLHEGLGGHVKGNLVGLLSGLAWACTLTGLRWLAKHEPGASAQAPVALGNLIAFLVCLPLSLPVAHFSASDMAIILYLGVFQIALAYLCLTASVRHVPAIEASTLLLVEPVFNPAWAWLLQGENPGGFALAGGALISCSAYCASWWKSRH